ncbi:aspartic proteinase CDR1-like [Corylus avellana]|uniref:aspartic proteinase CDR1-like n=1 Tax=Corylus avellana TaxID=13451 RepID=UPI00286AC2AD|nr:aspartic proteinase CDR1-like [Corylus avellana]
MASHHSLFSSAAIVTTFFICLLYNLSITVEAVNGSFSVDLIHRDSPFSPFYDPSETPSQRVANALQRSITRVNHFKPTSSSSLSPNELPRPEIVAVGGEYLMKYSVGTPPVPVLGVADTGSDLIWLQCEPCTDCYNQTDPLFDPAESKTYRNVSCSASECQSLEGTSCSSLLSSSSSCEYSVSYGDSSYSHGDLAFDSLTLESNASVPVSLSNIVVGCGHNNAGTFTKKGSGVVGLGRGAASLVTQLGSSIGGKFSYCLVPTTSQAKNSSKLSFGSDAVVSGSGAVSTGLAPKRPDMHFYFLTLEAISVGNKTLEFDDSSPFGDSEENIIIDSGTTLTLFPEDFYSRFEAAMAEEIDLERVDDPDERLSLCYKSASDDIGVPNITAHFRGADMKLNPMNAFLRVSEELVCFAFVASERIYIFGNVAQFNYLVGYDTEANTVSFKPTDCTNLLLKKVRSVL